MILVSFVGRTKLLYVVVEENGQPWFATSQVDSAGKTLESYTPEGFLNDWRPTLGFGARPQ